MQIGSNSGAGLIVEVFSTPSGNGLGGGWTFFGAKLRSDAFTVAADNSVTFADASFFRSADAQGLYFGGFGGFYPEMNLTDVGDGRVRNTYHADRNGQFAFVLDDPSAAVSLRAGLP